MVLCFKLKESMKNEFLLTKWTNLKQKIPIIVDFSYIKD